MGMGQNPGTPGEPQNSWVKMDVNNPLKMVLIGIDQYPYFYIPRKNWIGTFPRRMSTGKALGKVDEKHGEENTETSVFLPLNMEVRHRDLFTLW